MLRAVFVCALTKLSKREKKKTACKHANPTRFSNEKAVENTQQICNLYRGFWSQTNSLQLIQRTKVLKFERTLQRYAVHKHGNLNRNKQNIINEINVFFSHLIFALANS